MQCVSFCFCVLITLQLLGRDRLNQQLIPKPPRLEGNAIRDFYAKLHPITEMYEAQAKVAAGAPIIQPILDALVTDACNLVSIITAYVRYLPSVWFLHFCFYHVVSSGDTIKLLVVGVCIAIKWLFFFADKG